MIESCDHVIFATDTARLAPRRASNLRVARLNELLNTEHSCQPWLHSPSNELHGASRYQEHPNHSPSPLPQLFPGEENPITSLKIPTLQHTIPQIPSTPADTKAAHEDQIAMPKPGGPSLQPAFTAHSKNKPPPPKTHASTPNPLNPQKPSPPTPQISLAA